MSNEFLLSSIPNENLINEIFMLLSLPIDCIFEIGLSTPLQDLTNLCLSNSELNKILCGNEKFWKARYIRDFGIPLTLTPIKEIENWKILYRNEIGGEVWTFGNNNDVQLGLGDKINRNIPTRIQNIKAKAKYVACGGGHTIIIDKEENVWAFGDNEHGQLGLGNEINRKIPTKIPNIKAKSVACGYLHTMIIDKNENVWTFGINTSGQLGLGDVMDRLIPTQIQNIKAKKVTCGNYHTIIIE